MEWWNWKNKQRYYIKVFEWWIANAVFYIYGPPGLLNAMKNLLTIELSITKDRIREEEFYGYWESGKIKTLLV